MRESDTKKEVQDLLGQDTLLNSTGFEQNRRRLLERLEAAQWQEKRGRKITLLVSLGCFVVMLSIFTAASLKVVRIEEWPESLRTFLAMVIILCFVSSSLFAGVYLFRHRRELRLARKATHQQTLNELPQQLEIMRKEIELLRSELRDRKHEARQQ
jgi:hypothetical protein